MGGHFTNAGVFLIQTLFGIYEVIILLRLLMQLVRADFYNPISQFIVKATNPLLRPLRRLIPGIAGIDLASVLLLLLVIIIELLLTSLVTSWPLPTIIGLIALALVEMLKLLVYVYLFSIFVLAILSWVSPHSYNPVANILTQISTPVMRPARKIIPPISGLDLSPMAAIIFLYLVILLAINPLHELAFHLAYGQSPAILR